MNLNNSIVIVSHHTKGRSKETKEKRDIGWIGKFIRLGFHTLVYDHDPPAQNSVNKLYSVDQNKGREASVYLKYIIDFYDSLQAYTVFIQDDEYSWHHHGSLVKLIKNNIGEEIRFKNLNNRCLSTIMNNDLYPTMVEYFKKCLKPFIGPIEKYGDWTAGYKCCAQFIVHRDEVYKYPKKMYENMFKYMMNASDDEKAKGHMFEWTLHLLFDNPYSAHKMTETEFKATMAERGKKIEQGKKDEENVRFDGCRVIVDY